MTDAQIQATAEIYKTRLREHNAAPVRLGDGHSASKFDHLMWMCCQLQEFVTEGKLDKANRWLGFVQGCLWLYDFYSIEEMKDHNR
jgi:hypothetical protein